MKYFSMEKTVPVKLIQFQEEQKLMTVCNYDISFTMVTSFDNVDEVHEAQLQQDIGFSKIMTFLVSVIDGSVVFGAESSSELFSMLHEYYNNVIVLPEVSENYLLAALHCKLNAITSDATFVQQIKIYDCDEKVTYDYMMTDDEEYDELPSEEEWMGELSYWEGCWWNRPDVNTMDKRAESEEEYENWIKIREEQHIDELNMQAFRDIEAAFTNEEAENSGELISVDFKNSSAKEKKHVWKPVLVE
jgi:hypothetical protein